MKLIDLSTATVQQRNAMALVRQRIDARLGYPRAPTKPNGAPFYDPNNATFGVTTQCSEVLAHPTTGTRFALPISPEMIPHLVVIRAQLRAKVTGGTATALETAADALPAEVDADATWSQG